jgi:hypothetical protein
MHKVLIGLMVIFFLGDPGMQTLAWLGDMKLYIVAAAIAMVSIPFVTSQIDGRSRHDGSPTRPEQPPPSGAGVY